MFLAIGASRSHFVALTVAGVSNDSTWRSEEGNRLGRDRLRGSGKEYLDSPFFAVGTTIAALRMAFT